MIKAHPRWMKIAAAAIAVLALLGGGALLIHARDDRAAEAADDHLRDEELVTAAKTAVEADAPEAQSVSFGEVFAHREGSGVAVCGAVDIVQPDDGFDGLERFVYAQGDLKREETDGADTLSQRWRELCV